MRQTTPLRLACEEVDLSIVPIQSDEICVYALASMMEKKGWNTFTSCRPKSAPCPPLCSRPPVRAASWSFCDNSVCCRCMALCIGERHSEVLKDWVVDLRATVAELQRNPDVKVEGDAAVYGAAEALPDAILSSVMRSYLDVKLSVKHAAVPATP